MQVLGTEEQYVEYDKLRANIKHLIRSLVLATKEYHTLWTLEAEKKVKSFQLNNFHNDLKPLRNERFMAS